MSRAARRHQRRNQVGQTRERTLSVPLDQQWVDRLDQLSERIAANVREHHAIREATAKTLEISEDDAANLLEHYVDETDGGRTRRVCSAGRSAQMPKSRPRRQSAATTCSPG